MSARLAISIQPLRVAESNGDAVRLAEYWEARREGRRYQEAGLAAAT